MVAIIDYGLGNLRSVAGAVAKVGFEPIVTADPAVFRRADRLILPGVGAFG
ncbi:imidazole glycerol phosphate synthase subunit HisH, partial [Candidatus Uhrbacteria bacterium]|nr:imidazole glycerol phosphate synthase subunit HisH [Candidatus Uhrbacteria bacterium]